MVAGMSAACSPLFAPQLVHALFLRSHQRHKGLFAGEAGGWVFNQPLRWVRERGQLSRTIHVTSATLWCSHLLAGGMHSFTTKSATSARGIVG